MPRRTLPEIITDHPHFTLWKMWEGKKVPCKPNGYAAKPQDKTKPSGLLPFHEAEEHSLLGLNGIGGMGIVLREPGDIAIIDIDKVDEWDDPREAERLVKQLKRIGYVEKSPSGRGYHAIVCAELPENHKTRHKTFFGGKVEVYSRWRFVTLTRSGWTAAKDADKDHTEELEEIIQDLLDLGESERADLSDVEDYPQTMSDDEVLMEMAGLSNKGSEAAETFMHIYKNGMEDEDDASSSVHSAVSSLVTVTKNKDQILRLLTGPKSGFNEYEDSSGKPKLERWLSMELGGLINRRVGTEKRDAERTHEMLEERGYLDDFVWIAEGPGYFYDVRSGMDLSKSGVDDTFRYLHDGSRGNPLLSNVLLREPDLTRVSGKTWMPRVSWGVPDIDVIDVEGTDMVNTWRGYRVKPVKGDVEPWLDLMKHLFPDPVERDNMVRRIAFDIQYPDLKCSWSPVIIGIHGAGKDSMLMPLSKIFGAAQSSIEDKQIKSQYDDAFAGKKIVVVNEVRGLSGSSLESIKKKTAPENTGFMQLNIKGGKQITHRSLWSVYFLTNYSDAISVTATERRFYVLTCDRVMPKRLIERYFEPWLNKSGPSHLLHYLLNEVDLEGFDSTQVPARTDAFMDMVEDAELDGISAIKAAFEEGSYGFSHGLVNPRVVGQAMRAGTYKYCKDQDVRNALKDHGWQKIRTQPMKKIKGQVVTKSRGIFAPKDSELHTMRPAELYDAISKITAGGDFLEEDD